MVKDKVCKLIKNTGSSIDDMHRIQDLTRAIAIKAVGPKGESAQIRFSDRDSWIDPKSWASNHETNLVRSLCELMQRLDYISCDPNAVVQCLQGSRNESGLNFLNDLRGRKTSSIYTSEFVDEIKSELKEANDAYDELEADKAKVDKELSRIKDLLDTSIAVMGVLRCAITEPSASGKWIEKYRDRLATEYDWKLLKEIFNDPLTKKVIQDVNGE